MKFILISVGTRGDVEPFLAFGELLINKGHQIVCCFPAQYEHLATDSGFVFAPLSKDFLELVESEDGKMVMGGKASVFRKLGALIRMYKKSLVVNRKLVEQQSRLIKQEQPDKIIFNGKSTYPLIWGIMNPGKTILVSPIPCLIHYVRERPHVGFKKNLGPFFNRLTYALANFGFVKNMHSTTKDFRPAGIKKKHIKKALLEQELIYAISPSIFPKPTYWPDNTSVLGYHERNKTINWKPDRSLEEFLTNHPKVLLITFGSMSNPDPEGKTRMILNILEKHKIPALINTAAGGLSEPPEYDHDLIRFVSRIPYDWVLPNVYGIIHHGGSGTTHMGLKHGCPTMILPHIIDQYLWNDLVSDLGAGPKGIPIRKIIPAKLEPKILDLFENPEYLNKASTIAGQMNQENLQTELYNQLSDMA